MELWKAPHKLQTEQRTRQWAGEAPLDDGDAQMSQNVVYRLTPRKLHTAGQAHPPPAVVRYLHVIVCI